MLWSGLEEHARNRQRRHGAGKEKALSYVATKTLQLRQLFFRFNPLGDDAQPERMCERYRRRDNRTIFCGSA